MQSLHSSEKLSIEHSRHGSHQRLCQPANHAPALQVTCSAHLLDPNKLHGVGNHVFRSRRSPFDMQGTQMTAFMQTTAAPSLAAASRVTGKHSVLLAVPCNCFGQQQALCYKYLCCKDQLTAAVAKPSTYSSPPASEACLCKAASSNCCRATTRAAEL